MKFGIHRISTSAWLLAGVILWGIPFRIVAETYYFDTYSAQKGASSKIYCLLQDHHRFVWLGTPSGVQRFDGQQFENFSHSNGMAAQAVRALYQDSAQRIWLGHAGGGISVWDREHFLVYTRLSKFIRGDITRIFQDSRGAYWFTTEASGAFCLADPFVSDSLVFQHYMGENNLSDRVYNYCQLSDGRLFLITDVGIRQFQTVDSTFTGYHPHGLTRYFSVIAMLEDREKNQWFGTYNGGLYKYLPSRDTTYAFDIRDGLTSNWISDLVLGQDGAIWIATWGGGLSRVKGSNVVGFTSANGLVAQYLFAIREDVEGNLLIASSNDGLAVYKGDVFVHYNQGDGLQHPDILAIAQAGKDGYWVGTEEGICQYPIRHHVPRAGLEHSRFFPLRDPEIPAGPVKYMCKSNDHTLWIGTDTHGVWYCDLATHQWQEASVLNSWLEESDYPITCMDARRQELWVGTYDGLLKYHLPNASVQRFSTEHGLVGDNITAVYCDREGTTWVGAYVQAGISRIDRNDSVGWVVSGAAITPTCMATDYQGVLWLGTRSQGVFRCSGDTLVEVLDVEQGLLSNRITSLLADTLGNLYIGTDKGINVWVLPAQRLITYNERNGFVGVECNPLASCQGPDGKVWFGTHWGINAFDPTDLKRMQNEAHVFLTEFRINNELREFLPGMHLKPRENHVAFRFKSICLTNPDAVRYRYRLEGVENEWQMVSTQNQVTYQTLPPGRYNFQVMACNSSGVWNRQPEHYSFLILSPLYKRWYFILSLGVVLFVAIRVYITIRERSLLLEKSLLEDKVQARTIQLSQANVQLERKNKDITDSIRYAQRIQMAILPSRIPFGEVMILFQPKDIVSGDFYWLATQGTKELMAAVDCTGHGVPGAFISFIGYSSLNKVVKEKGITQPSEVLDKVNESIVQSLNLQSEDAIKDGMDLALICYDREKQLLEYAGAFNPLYLIRGGELTEIKADRFAIGKSNEATKRFTPHRLRIEKGDTAYIFSDGYADQFGGEENKKFKTTHLKSLLVSIQDKNMEEQKQILKQIFSDWKGENEQIDDVLIMGRRF